MFKKVSTVLTIILVASAGTLAQPARQPALSLEEETKARGRIFVMESVLERAVQDGADNLRMRVHRVMPDMMLISGSAEARGVRLEGYGVFFDVAVPVLRRSVAWSLRTMVDENGMGASSALQTLRSLVDAQTDPRARANLQQAIQRLERQVGGPLLRQPPSAVPARPGQPPPPGTMVAATAEPPAAAAASAEPSLAVADEALLMNPDEAYTNAVKNALIDSMLEYSHSLRIGADEWLTVAAREQRMAAGDRNEVATLVFRIRGADLAAYHADRITRDEALKRVEAREF